MKARIIFFGNEAGNHRREDARQRRDLKNVSEEQGEQNLAPDLGMPVHSAEVTPVELSATPEAEAPEQHVETEWEKLLEQIRKRINSTPGLFDDRKEMEDSIFAILRDSGILRLSDTVLEAVAGEVTQKILNWHMGVGERTQDIPLDFLKLDIEPILEQFKAGPQVVKEEKPPTPPPFPAKAEAGQMGVTPDIQTPPAEPIQVTEAPKAYANGSGSHAEVNRYTEVQQREISLKVARVSKEILGIVAQENNPGHPGLTENRVVDMVFEKLQELYLKSKNFPKDRTGDLRLVAETITELMNSVLESGVDQEVKDAALEDMAEYLLRLYVKPNEVFSGKNF